MKLKMIVVASVMAAAALFIAGSGCSRSSNESSPAGSQTAALYTCPMHPSVKSDKPGSCSICGMTLVRVSTNAPAAKP